MLTSAPQANWTAAIKQQLGWMAAEDGTFWMDFNDACQIFGEFSWLVVNASWHRNATAVFELGSGMSKEQLQISVSEPVHLYNTLMFPTRHEFFCIRGGY
jgi:hypothetical protein